MQQTLLILYNSKHSEGRLCPPVSRLRTQHAVASPEMFQSHLISSDHSDPECTMRPIFICIIHKKLAKQINRLNKGIFRLLSRIVFKNFRSDSYTQLILYINHITTQESGQFRFSLIYVSAKNVISLFFTLREISSNW